MKRAEKYALARLMIKWGYYDSSDQQTFFPDFSDSQRVVCVFINDLLSVLQVPRSDIDLIAEKMKLVEVSQNG